MLHNIQVIYSIKCNIRYTVHSTSHYVYSTFKFYIA